MSLARVTGGTESTEGYDPEAVVGACVDGLRRVDELWREWPVDAKTRVQRLVFPEGVGYDEMAGSRTPRLSQLYDLIPASSEGASKMAPPSWPPANRVIEEVVAWYEVLRTVPGEENTAAGR